MSFARKEPDEAVYQSFSVGARERNREEDERRNARAAYLKAKNRERALYACEDSPFLKRKGVA